MISGFFFFFIASLQLYKKFEEHQLMVCLFCENEEQQWHPDRWTRTPSLLSEAKHKFQQIQEAYSGK